MCPCPSIMEVMAASNQISDILPSIYSSLQSSSANTSIPTVRCKHNITAEHYPTCVALHKLLGSRNENIFRQRCLGNSLVKSAGGFGNCGWTQESINSNWSMVHFIKMCSRNVLLCSLFHPEYYMTNSIEMYTSQLLYLPIYPVKLIFLQIPK